MDQNEFVIFAELDPARFDQIVERLKRHFKNIEYGRQGDDWIWVHHKKEKIEIDTFFSNNLEVKGRRRQYQASNEILKALEDEWIIKIFSPPRVDTSRGGNILV
jgi:hypothetical protein